MNYNVSKKINGTFEEAIEKLAALLQKEGFGIISEIDLQEKFKEKLGKDFRKYKILGACNPALAYEAIQDEPNVGVMLPCNILVQETMQGGVEVSAINPIASIGAVDNPKLRPLAEEVSNKLKKVIEGL